ncbi:DUF1127 domain-containing protein [Nisaea sp.]|uniref:DUF1127 domain-containing protein n=1 Tax=Nisaea sp. TaxID=2024842 RepID=UPI003298AA29
MHLRHQHRDPTCAFRKSHIKQLGQPISESVFRLIRAADTAIHRGLHKIARERLRRARIKELQGLTDHQLLDIGVERSEIAATVEKVLERKVYPR